MPVREIPRSHTSMIGQHSWIPGGGSVALESLLERDFVSLMAFDNDVVKIEEQPVRIIFANKRSYVPDFLVTHANRGLRLIEVKPKRVLDKRQEEFAPKFAAASKFATERDWTFEIWTEREIHIPRLENANFLLPFRRETPDPGLAARLVRDLHRSGPISIYQLVTSCWDDHHEQSRGLATLWCLLSIGKIVTDLNVEFDMSSPIWIGDQLHD
ncbi:MAG: TnsA endonuclease N-terminal domain-containing protein [Phycisphaeraceae bacterium]|nr:TnsA endonuclease N-terminal domain-containing protein [Phycisphaeraceae bacterium]